MEEGILIPPEKDEPEQGSLQVQFALVLARTIEAIREDPDHLREAVYQLARYKLREQVRDADFRTVKKTKEALETAIAGVEQFAKHGTPLLSLTSDGAPSPVKQLETTQISSDALQPIVEMQVVARKAPGTPTWDSLKRTAILLLCASAAVVILLKRDQVSPLFNRLSTRTAPLSEIAGAPLDAKPPPAPLPKKVDPLLPAQYGIYSVSGDELRELQLLPGRAPDIRVAVSAAIKTPSQTVLPNGHPRFIVFRRDLAASASDRAEVRIIAKVIREFTPQASGKKLDSTDETWVIRNVAFQFRASPVPENPEMFELHSDDQALELPPGRYALVIKGQAYDFTVQGNTTDPRQCIERVVAVNGTFYSDCKKM